MKRILLYPHISPTPPLNSIFFSGSCAIFLFGSVCESLEENGKNPFPLYNATFLFSGLYRLDRLHFIVCFNVFSSFIFCPLRLPGNRRRVHEARMPQDEIVSSRRPPAHSYFIFTFYSDAGSATKYIFPLKSVQKNYFIASLDFPSLDSFKVNITSVLPAHTMAHCPGFLSEHQKILSVSLPNFCFNFVSIFFFCYNSISECFVCVRSQKWEHFAFWPFPVI